MKTHLPVDALVFSQKAKYVYVGRDARDVMWSMSNHHTNANDMWYDALNNTPGRVGPAIGPAPKTAAQYFAQWLDNDGMPLWPYWENIRSWWEIRDHVNVSLVHFADLKADLAGQIAHIAAFLEIDVTPEVMEKFLHHCSFDYMKENAAESVPLGGAFWEGGAQTFIHKGTNGRWRDDLDPAVSERYLARAEKELGSQCAQWLVNGSLG